MLEAMKYLMALKRFGVSLDGAKIGPDALVLERRIDPERGGLEITFAQMCAGLQEPMSCKQLKQQLLRWIELTIAID